MNEQEDNSARRRRARHERALLVPRGNRSLSRTPLGVSPAVRQHLANSRIEFLKAIREVIDERIERPLEPRPTGHQDCRRVTGRSREAGGPLNAGLVRTAPSSFCSKRSGPGALGCAKASLCGRTGSLTPVGASDPDASAL